MTRTSVSAASPDIEVGAPGDEIEVTPAMVEAGIEVLWNSRAIEHPLESDRQIIRDVYQAMQSARSELVRLPRR